MGRSGKRRIAPGSRGVDGTNVVSLSTACQFVAGVERDLGTDLVVEARYIRRAFADFMVMADTGSVWQPIEIPDWGPDGRFGTDDDGPWFTAYQRVNPGSEFFLLTNDDEAYRRYDGFQVVGSKRWAQGWQVQASYTWSRTVGTVGNDSFSNAGFGDARPETRVGPGVFVNPNGRIDAEGRATYDVSEIKVLGVYEVDVLGGFLVSGILTRHTGNRWERKALYAGVLTGTPARLSEDRQLIRVEPRGARVLPPVWNADLRVEKTFGVRPRGTIRLALDVLNLTNQGIPLAVEPVSGPSFGVTRAIADPRLARVVVRYTF